MAAVWKVMPLLTVPILGAFTLMLTVIYLPAMISHMINRAPHERSTRDVAEEHGNVNDVIQLLNGKCFDKAPNCNQELCQKHHISFWKKCKKTCGACDPMMKIIKGIKEQKTSMGQ